MSDFVVGVRPDFVFWNWNQHAYFCTCCTWQRTKLWITCRPPSTASDFQQQLARLKHLKQSSSAHLPDGGLQLETKIHDLEGQLRNLFDHPVLGPQTGNELKQKEIKPDPESNSSLPGGSGMFRPQQKSEYAQQNQYIDPNSSLLTSKIKPGNELDQSDVISIKPVERKRLIQPTRRLFAGEKNGLKDVERNSAKVLQPIPSPKSVIVSPQALHASYSDWFAVMHAKTALSRWQIHSLLFELLFSHSKIDTAVVGMRKALEMHFTEIVGIRISSFSACATKRDETEMLQPFKSKKFALRRRLYLRAGNHAGKQHAWCWRMLQVMFVIVSFRVAAFLW